MIIALFFAMPLGAKQPDPDFLVIPNKALGKYALAWTIDQFWQEFGANFKTGTWQSPAFNPTSQQFDGPRFTVRWYAWDDRMIEVLTRPDQNDRVIGINIAFSKNADIDEANRQYRTGEGIGLYSTAAEVQQAYGKPDWDYGSGRVRFKNYNYNAGIIFMFWKDKPDEVIQFGVWSREGWQ